MRKSLPASTLSPPAPALHAVVFDMDGVIVDSHPAHRFAWREFLHLLGRNVSDAELDFVMDGRKREDILAHFLGPLTENQLREYGRLKNELFWHAASEVVPISGVFEFVECLRSGGIAMAVATSASAGRTYSILHRTGLISCFRAVVTGDEVRKGKPDPDIYRLACQRIGCAPDSAVAVEDAASGIHAAKAAGLKCVGIADPTRKKELAEAGADCILENLENVTLRRFLSLVGMRLAQASNPGTEDS